jgi:hypothetical protein
MTRLRSAIFTKIQKYLSKPSKNETFEIKDGILMLKNTDLPIQHLLTEMGIGYTIYDIADSEGVLPETIQQALKDLATIFGDDTTKNPAEIGSFKELFKLLYEAGLDRLGPR